jgi:hypothetical protein
MRALRLLGVAMALMAAGGTEACENTAASPALVASMQEMVCPKPGATDLRAEIFDMLFSGFDGLGDTVDVRRLSRILNQMEAEAMAGEKPAAAGALIALLERTPALITGLRASVVSGRFDPSAVARWCEWRRLGAGEDNETTDAEITRIEEAVRCGL